MLISERLATNIAVLCAVSDSPPQDPVLLERPTTNALPTRDHVLPSKREQQLAHMIAFIAATSKEPETVLAVAVEERENGTGLTIRLAANSGSLDEAVTGLRRIFGTLQTVSRGRKLSLSAEPAAIDVTASREQMLALWDESVLHAVLDLGYKRILTRIRSRYGRMRKVQQPVARALLNTFTFRSNSQIKKRPSLRKLRDQARSLSYAFELFEACADPEQLTPDAKKWLLEILDLALDISKGTELSQHLQACDKLEPTAKEYIPEILRKLAQYKTYAALLVRGASGRYRKLFRHVEVHAITKPDLDPLFQIPTLTSLTTAIRLLNLRAENGMSLPQSQLLSNVSPRAQLNFDHTLALNIQDRKVHAEVQLLSFYESHPQVPKPRFIISNKLPCLPCWTLLHAHGMYATNESHGRTYKGWTLPVFPGGLPERSERNLNAAVNKTSSVLEGLVLKALQIRPKGGHKPESIAQSFSPFSSILTTSSLTSWSRISSSRHVVPADHPSESINEHQHDSTEQAPDSGAGSAVEASLLVEKEIRESTSSLTPEAPVPNEQLVPQHPAIKYPLDDASKRHNHREKDVQLIFELGDAPPTSNDETFSVTVQRIHLDDLPASSPIIDIETLGGGGEEKHSEAGLAWHYDAKPLIVRFRDMAWRVLYSRG